MSLLSSCLRSPILGNVDLTYEPADTPGTPSGEVVTALQLVPRGAGESQTFVHAGANPLEPTGRFYGTGPERLPGLDSRDWWATLEPNQEYCATITVRGRNDTAGPVQTSEPICAHVVEVELDDNGQPRADGGCAVAAGRSPAPALLLVLIAFVGMRRGRARRPDL